MVRSCMEQQQPFVVTPLTAGAESSPQVQFIPMGCTAAIVDWDSLPSGLLGIKVQGQEVVRLDSVWQEPDGLWRGQGELLGDSRQLALPDDYQGLRELLQQIHPGEIDDSRVDCSAFGWMLAAALPLSAKEMQLLFAERDPVERLEQLVSLIDRLSQR